MANFVRFVARCLRELRDNARRYAGQVADLGCAITGDLENVGFGAVPDDFAENWVCPRISRCLHALMLLFLLRRQAAASHRRYLLARMSLRCWPRSSRETVITGTPN